MMITQMKENRLQDFVLIAQIKTKITQIKIRVISFKICVINVNEINIGIKIWQTVVFLNKILSQKYH